MAIDFNEEPYAATDVSLNQLPKRNRAIDYDRGMIKMTHPTAGVEVYMYWDSPGTYLNAFGKPVADKFAEACGFDIQRFGKAKRRIELMQVARDKIEEELRMSGTTRNVVVERGGYRVVDIGGDRFILEDIDGNVITPAPVSRDMAVSILDDVIPSDDAAPDTSSTVPSPPRVVKALGK